MRRVSIIVLFASLLALATACTNKKATNPLANVGSKQPDKVLFDRSMDALKHNKFDVARMTLQTLINTYPDSEYIARAKLGVADSWYAEGGTTALQQAEIEYKDFKTFFPNMPEAAEAQLKVANIHYQQMEKPDRDFTHAMRAEDEYRALLQEYPDSKLVPEAKQRLREVQEVLAQREFNIGQFYVNREAYAAGIARLQTLVDRYPLYSGADEALYLIGQAREAQIAVLRRVPTCTKSAPTTGCLTETKKADAIERLAKEAAEPYQRIIQRYPAMDRALDAKARLEALHQPVPRPTKAALEQNKKEVASRREPGMMSSAISAFERRPGVEKATHVGEPTMTDPQPVNANDVVQQATRALTGGTGSTDTKVSAETVNAVPGPNQEAPRSDTTTTTPPATPETPPDQGNASATSTQTPATDTAQPTAADPNELKPNVADPTALPPLQQSNDVAAGSTSTSASASGSGQGSEELADISSSKKKKKKGVGKLNPF